MGAESLNLRRIAHIASGRDNKHASLKELNPVKVRAEANSDFKQHSSLINTRGRGAVGELARRRRRPHLPLGSRSTPAALG
jgi:hypothetical protein